MARYPEGQQRSALGPALEAVQQQIGFLPDEAMEEVAALFDIEPAEVQAFVGFYHMLRQNRVGTYHVEVCTNVPCLLRGAGLCADRLKEKLGVDWGGTTDDGMFTLDHMECLGSCATAPVVSVTKRQSNWSRYYENLSTDERIDAVLRELRQLAEVPDNKLPVPERSVPRTTSSPLPGRDIGPFHHDHHPETNFILARIDQADSHELAGYERDGGYQTAKEVVGMGTMSGEEVKTTVRDAGLRGRGGAGFPAGVKWGFLPEGVFPRYLVVNADESEPGTFKDRLIIEYDPHQLIEGIILSAYACQANRAFIYIRGEYFFGARRLEKAIAEARDAGYIGKGIFGSDFDLEITVHRGAGAYICGEETALLSSLEGFRGHPRLKPPFPAIEGLYAKPTIVNNIETISQVVHIVKNGSAWYRQWGTEKSPGFALYCLSGSVKKPGVYELPYGTTVRSLIYDFAGGTIDDRPIKCIIPGGLSAPSMPVDLIDEPMDFETIASLGSMLGSGGIIVICEGENIVEVTRRMVGFYREESCGKCSPCREGVAWLEKILLRIEHGRGIKEDLDTLERLTYPIEHQSFCPFGPAAVWGLRSMLKLFRDDFERYIEMSNPEGKAPQLPVRAIYRPDVGTVAPDVRT
ncbi:MAG: NADH-quinone oxidoreductase subunit NuoF [Chloroflexota bacterium]|nr:NADH-quinone oxidoreductase subunit NuoF [Chloroflexota bacterium]